MERLGPVDIRTGLPLPILPATPPSHVTEHPRLSEEACRLDQHHAFYPNASLVGEGERVLRHSRLQYGVRWAHGRYHEFFDAVPLPTDVDTQFRLGVLAAAGYIPEKAVDISGSKPRVVRLQPDVRLRMQEETVYPEVRINRLTGQDMYHKHRGIFFMNYAINQNFDHIREVLLEEFQETADAERRLKLGLFIVDMAFRRATDSIMPVYSAAYRKGLIHPAQRKHPVGFLRRVVAGHQPNYFPTILERIGA